MTETIINLDSVNPIEFFGVNNGKLDVLKKKFPLLKILSRGTQLKLSGAPEQIETAVEKVIPFTCVEDAEVVKIPTYQELADLPPAKLMPIVAVYGFLDKTGQRKRMDGVASFSTAVTQGAEAFLIDALKTAGKGKWFRVVERTNLDALVRERQIVRSAREDFANQEGNEDSPTGIQPLLFAGILLDGGIIGYDTNIESGGRGARTLGVGASVSYRRDVVTVSLRGISVLTGEILLNVQTTKTILSTGGGYDVFKFMDMDTQLVEVEDGVATNEGV